jgi:hypothetical protein
MPNSTAANVTAGSPDPHLLADMVAQGRDLAADVFDTYLYNSMRFTVSTLAPFRRLVDADGYPYLVRRSHAGAGGSLFLPIPGSLFSIELMSDFGLEDAARASAWDVCSGA